MYVDVSVVAAAAAAAAAAAVAAAAAAAAAVAAAAATAAAAAVAAAVAATAINTIKEFKDFLIFFEEFENVKIFETVNYLFTKKNNKSRVGLWGSLGDAWYVLGSFLNLNALPVPWSDRFWNEVGVMFDVGDDSGMIRG